MSAKFMMLLAVVIVCLLAVSVIAAAPGEPAALYSIDLWTVAGSGGSSGGGIYALSGISGQPVAQTSSGGTYVLSGGFWNEGIVAPYRIHLPVILK
jgi:hypothetical protein